MRRRRVGVVSQPGVLSNRGLGASICTSPPSSPHLLSASRNSTSINATSDTPPASIQYYWSPLLLQLHSFNLLWLSIFLPTSTPAASAENCSAITRELRKIWIITSTSSYIVSYSSVSYVNIYETANKLKVVRKLTRQ